MKPMVNTMAGWNSIRPRYIVNIQSKIFTPVGTAMIIVAIPKMAFTLAEAPIVKKWCSQTVKESKAIQAVA
jgi:hypothetical protein